MKHRSPSAPSTGVAIDIGTHGRSIDILALSGLWLLMAIIVFPAGDHPVNDDWVYAASVRSLIETGRFEVLSFATANVGPQAYWGALFARAFGLSYASLRASTVVLGLAGGIGVYLLFREIWQDRLGALVLALTLLVNPVYFSLAYTFMTDVPFIALIVTSMLLIAIGVRRERPGLLASGLAVALLGVLLRQFAVVVLVGFACMYVVFRERSIRTFVIAVSPLVAGLVLNWLFNKWMVDTGRKPFPSPATGLLAAFIPKAYWLVRSLLLNASSYVGLFLIPAAIYYLPANRLAMNRRSVTFWSALGLLAALIGAFYLSHDMAVPIGGNVLGWFGVGPLTNGDTLMQNQNLPQESPGVDLAWKVVTGLSAISSAGLLIAAGLCAARLYREWHAGAAPPPRREAAFVAFFVGTVLSYVGVLLLLAAAYPLFDRYFLLLFILCGFAVPYLRITPGRVEGPGWGRFALALLPLACSATFSVVATHDYFAWSGVRWAALQQLLAEGVSPSQIDGGYEFSGSYLYDPHYEAVEGKNWWWVIGDQYQVSSGPIAGYREMRRFHVDRWWDNGASDVFIMKR